MHAVFDTAAAAEEMAAGLHVGEKTQGGPESITFRTVEVREVLASV